jgi:hypothetical protein
MPLNDPGCVKNAKKFETQQNILLMPIGIEHACEFSPLSEFSRSQDPKPGIRTYSLVCEFPHVWSSSRA